MKKCEECIYLNTSICVYKCYKKDHLKNVLIIVVVVSIMGIVD